MAGFSSGPTQAELKKVEDLKAKEIDQLKADLAKFGGHTAECNIYTWKEISDLAPANCDCGYDKAKERWK